MSEADLPCAACFRVWITRYNHWRPNDFRDVPEEAVALEPAEEGVMSSCQAAAYVEAFNRVAIERAEKIWAVAVPVTVCYGGEPRPGQRIVLRRPHPAAGPSAR